jgi:hypothetical protein
MAAHGSGAAARSIRDKATVANVDAAAARRRSQSAWMAA